jgi:hypothetical protein
MYGRYVRCGDTRTDQCEKVAESYFFTPNKRPTSNSSALGPARLFALANCHGYNAPLSHIDAGRHAARGGNRSVAFVMVALGS